MAGVPYNRVNVISNALILLGKKKISSIPEGGEVAADADAIFDQLLQAELSNPNWRFATHVKQLSQIAGVNPGYKGFSAAYQKPADLLALWQIWPQQYYEIFQDRIWTGGGNNTIQVEYRAPTEVSKLPPAFINYFVFVVAYNLGLGLTENDRMLARIEKSMDNARARAMNVNSQERPNKAIQSSPWIENRSDGYGGFWGVT